MNRLNGGSQLEAFEAAKEIIRNREQYEPGLVLEVLRNGKRPFNRAAAAYAMSAFHDPRFIPRLEKILADQSEHSSVRGEVAEALTHFHRKKTHPVMRRALEDKSKEVRFWCCFALGEMKDKRSVPLLKVLAAKDHRIVRGWWKVSKEASAALDSIGKARGACPYCVD